MLEFKNAIHYSVVANVWWRYIFVYEKDNKKILKQV